MTVILNKDNAEFFMEENLLYCFYNNEKQRVFLHLAFPYEQSEAYVSVLDTEGEEIGMIMSVAELNEPSAQAVRHELSRKYYTPKIEKILEMKEKNGYAYWKVELSSGEVSFTVRDNFRSIFRIGNEKIIIYDIDGNRFMIEPLSSLPKSSRRKIELYL